MDDIRDHAPIIITNVTNLDIRKEEEDDKKLHSHGNIEVLEGFSDFDGNLLYNGSPIAAGGEGSTILVQANWNETDSAKAGFINNKPSVLSKLSESVETGDLLFDGQPLVKSEDIITYSDAQLDEQIANIWL